MKTENPHVNSELNQKLKAELSKKNIDISDIDSYYLDISEDNKNQIAYSLGDKRIRTSLGRFIRRRLGIDCETINDTELARLCAKVMGGKLDQIMFELLKGEDLVDAYRRSVGKTSCMTGDCADYTKFYGDNPKKVRLAVATRADGAQARCLVWSTSKGLAYDRLYSEHEDMIEFLRDKLKSWGLWNAYSEEKRATIDYMRYNDDEIPYVDSFYYATENNGGLTLKNYNSGYDYELRRTDGQLNPYSVCCVCGCSLSDDDPRTDDDGDSYCEDCYNDRYTQCDDCNCECLSDTITYLDRLDRYVCESCLRDDYTYCQHCEDYVENCEIVSIADGDNVCSKCFESEGISCHCCADNYMDADNVTCIDDEYYCNECRDEKFAFCDECQEWIAKDMVVDGICSDCRESADVDCEVTCD
jgi:hypothetical protein